MIKGIQLQEIFRYTPIKEDFYPFRVVQFLSKTTEKQTMFSFKISREVPTDVLIIGAGAAGIRTAISLHHHRISSLIISKRELGDAHTRMASGGINAAMGSLDVEDRWEIHAADTLREGHFINDPTAVEMICRHAPEAIKELDGWGCPFDKTEEEKINQRFFGAQSYRRTCFVGDKTGKAILDTLVNQVKSLNIPYMDGIFIFHLVKHHDRVIGALGLDKRTKEVVFFRSSYVVVAAGGYASIYSRSSSRQSENTGDSIYLSYHAGAKLMDLEMVQFHPTGMVKPVDFAGKLVTEAVRGEGGYLLNKHGERFMSGYSPDKMELDARDEVARAIAQEIFKGNGSDDKAVYLDISHKDAGFIKERLPKMYERFKGLGLDITKEAMEVAPTSHYSMGGMEVDFRTGRSNVEGLYAVGEATGGLHGANRLGGNSLIETLVLGKLSGEEIARKYKTGSPRPAEDYPSDHLVRHFNELEGYKDPGAYRDRIKMLMWEHAGIIRKEELLERGLQQLQEIREDLSSSSTKLSDLSFEEAWQSLELSQMLLVADLVLQAALYRKESRGTHYREDYPDSVEDWKVNILFSKDQRGGVKTETKNPGKYDAEVEKALKENHSLNYHQLE